MFERMYKDTLEWESVTREDAIDGLENSYNAERVESILDLMAENPMTEINSVWAVYRWNPDSTETLDNIARAPITSDSAATGAGDVSTKGE